MQIVPKTKNEWKRMGLTLGLIFSGLGIIVLIGYLICISMPGSSHKGPLPELTQAEQALQPRLEEHVNHLAITIGERHSAAETNFIASRDYIMEQFSQLEMNPQLQTFEAMQNDCSNIEAEIPGTSGSDQVILIGAHYDTAYGTPGADDNGSGIAALIEIARYMKTIPARLTTRFVAFANEEPPFFQQHGMGSLHYAAMCRERGDNLAAVYVLESLGYYTDEPDSQVYPVPVLAPFFPDQGNFIAFVGNLASRAMVRAAIKQFRQQTPFPSEGIASPAWVPGIGYSDQWSFWQKGYQAIMVTDIPILRNPHYHKPSDLPDKIDFDKFTRVTYGMCRLVEWAANQTEEIL